MVVMKRRSTLACEGWPSKHLQKHNAHMQGTSLSHGSAHRLPKNQQREVLLHSDPPERTGGFTSDMLPSAHISSVSVPFGHVQHRPSTRMQRQSCLQAQPDLSVDSPFILSAQVLMLHSAALKTVCSPVEGSSGLDWEVPMNDGE